MGIDTDLNQSPYYDDFDETKNFHRVLFKPGVAVQARELTQLQSILQNQIERFGSNILREGTIISGCAFTEVELRYVKILDLTTTGQPVSMSSYIDTKAVGVTSGIEARIQLVATGLESQSPNLNTLFVKYTTTGTSGQKVFNSNENIQIRNATTNSLIATVTVAGSVDANSIGFSYGLKTEDGVIYQKGHFVRVNSQLITVSKYTNLPNDVVVGFTTAEEIINSNNDTSLLDNANGYNNFNAPGADRLKLSPTLTVKTLAEAEADEEFFAIQEYNLGKVVRRNRITQYDGILKVMEQRTKEESGNYVVKGMEPGIIPHTSGNTDLLSVTVSRGTAYVEGKRVELLDTIDIDLNKSTEYLTEENQNVSQNIGNYILVDNFAGDFEPNKLAQATLYNANTGGSAIGSAHIRGVELDSGTAGTSTAQYRIYLFNINMNSGNSWGETKSIRYTGGSVSASAQLISTKRYDTNLTRAVFPIGRSAVKKIPAQGTSFDFIRRTQQDVILTNTSTEISSISANEWPYGDTTLSTQQKEELILIPQTTNAAGGYTAGTPVDLSSATVTVSGSGTSMSIAGLSAPDASVTFTLVHNEKLVQTAPAGKDLITMYIKIDTDTHTNGRTGPWSLGVPDVYSIENIWVNNGSYAETNDKKNFFNLLPGRLDAYYNLSSIKRKNITLTSGDQLLVKVKAFKKNTGGSNGPAVFTIDSYPIDDANTANTAAIQTQNIPLDVSSDGRTTIDLRNAIDMRPQVSNTAVYATTSGTATENPADTKAFADTDQYTPAPNQYFETDYEYYLARKDFFMLDEKGKFVNLQGEPGSNPAPPSEPTKGMVLARIDVAPYPSLDPRTAGLLGKKGQSVRIAKRDNKRYTMRDISGIEKRITNLEYYTTLNAIETSAKDLVITDVNGLDRFKNGIFADGFTDLSGSDIRNIEFSAALSPEGNGIQARTKTIPMDLTRSGSGSNVDIFPKFGAVTLNEVSTDSFISQPYATTFRNCVTDYYKFKGSMYINPPYDSAFDNTQAPNVQFTVDTATPIIELTELINEYYPLSRTNREIVQLGREVDIDTDLGGNRTTTTSTTTVTNQVTSTTEGVRTSTIESEQSVGEFVTDVSLSPFIRPKTIFFTIFGLRPNTDHYAYFDGIAVSDRCGTAESNDDTDVDNIMEFVKTSERNTQLTSDSNGTIRGFFDIPEGTFYNGDRTLEIVDVDGADQRLTAATSMASAVYNAYNFSSTTSELTMLTREVAFVPFTEVNVTEETQVTQNVQVRINREENDPDRPRDPDADPISQTFTISKDHTTDSVVMLSKMDLFFNRKDSNLGLDIQIRDTKNGYPGSKVLGSVHVKSDDVVANTSSANTSTTIDFRVPIPLSVGNEYCFVVMPEANSPEYLIYTAQVGGEDLDRNIPITQDSHNGTLFYSTNNRAWTAIQDQNIKFNLYKGQYSNTASGSHQLKFKDPEFLDIEVVGNSLTIGEDVAILNANAAGTLAINASSKSVIGTSVDFTYLNTNDWIAYYANSTVIDTVRIKTVDAANNQLTLYSKPRYSNTAVNYFKTVRGNLSYFDGTSKYVLENSNAETGTTIYDNGSGNTIINNYFTANDTVFSSGSIGPVTGTITEVVNQNLSYIQPNIYKVNTPRTKVPFYLNTLRNTTYTDYVTSDTSKFMPTNDMTYLNTTKTVVPSMSNLKANSVGGEPLTIYYRPGTTSVDSTPIVDYEISNCFLHEYIINNDLTNEEDPTQLGNASTRWISKTAVLGEGFEADDMSLFITAYRPPTTDLKVYVKFQNGTDPNDLDDVYWTPLAVKSGSDAFSSTTNRYDYKELEYYIPSVANTAALSAGAAAALSEDDEYILHYKDSSGILYAGYSKFKIKVVMTSTDGHKLSPRMKDIRAIALS